MSESEDEKFEETVDKYGKILHCCTALTNDGHYSAVGKTIMGVTEDGEFAQAIVVRSYLITAMYCDLMTRNGVPEKLLFKESGLKDIGLVKTVHEIGHAVDNENIILSKKILLLNGFLKKSTKDYSKQIKIAERILKGFEL